MHSLSTPTWLQRMGFGPGTLPYQEITESTWPVQVYHLRWEYLSLSGTMSVPLFYLHVYVSALHTSDSIIFDSMGGGLRSFYCSTRGVCIGQ